MKIFLLKLICAVLTCLYSVAILSAPSKCPNIDDIRYRGLLYAQSSLDGDFIALQFDIYGTQNAWAFVIGKIKAAGPKEALAKAKKILPTVTGNPEPVQESTEWGCYYQNEDSSLAAIAFLLDSDVDDSLTKKYHKLTLKKKY